MSEAMRRLTKAAIFTPGPKGWGLPMLFWGDPGVAKTDIIESVGLEYGMHVETLSPGERGEAAFGVVPVPITKKDGTVRMTNPAADWLDAFEDEADEQRRGILFLDEINTAPSAVLPALLGLIQSRRHGSDFIGKFIRVLGAANPPESSANGRDLPAANANRMGHIDWEAPDAQAWTSWLIDHDAKHMATKVKDLKDPIAEETRVLGRWDMEHAKVKGLLAGFIRKRPELLHMLPDPGSPQASRAWQSRRTWDLAGRAMTSAKIHGLSEVEEMVFITAFVGSGGSTELFKYRQEADLPDPLHVLDGKVRWSPENERVDKTMAVLSACTAVIVSESCDKREARLETMWGLLSKVGDDMKDIALVAAEPLILKDYGLKSKAGIAMLAKVTPMVQAAKRANAGR